MGIVAQFQGFVNVPIFDSQNSFGSVISFTGSSYGPVLVTDPTLQSFQSSALASVNAQLLLVGGISTLQMGSAGSGGNVQPMNYFDGYMQQVNSQANSAFFYRKYCPKIAGNHDASNYWNIETDTIQAINKAYVTDLFPAYFQSKLAAASMYATGGDYSMLTVRYDNTIPVGSNWFSNPGPGWQPVPVHYGAPTAGATWSGNRLDPFTQTGMSNGNDNVFVQWPSAGAGANILYWNSSDVTPPAFNAWSLDKPSLDAYFQSRNYNRFIWPGGFIVCLETSGAGPTGQANEVIVFNTDGTQYYIIRFVPQDNYSQQQVTSGTAWNVAIDEEGVIWLSNGLTGPGTRVSYSYSPTGFKIPTIQVPPLNPFTLPCYNTCSPVSLIN